MNLLTAVNQDLRVYPDTLAEKYKNMKSERIGYIRVSTFDQNIDRQLEGVELDKVFIDKASGKDRHREQLQALIDYARDGDQVFVHSMDRLARNLEDLKSLVKDFTDQNIKVHFLKEGLTFTGDDSPVSNLMLSIMGAVAEFERSLIKERQREGIAQAKKKGLYKGRKKALSQDQIALLLQRVESGEAKTHIAEDLGISRETLYKYLKLEKVSS